MTEKMTMKGKCDCCGTEAELTHEFCPACIKVLNKITTERVREMWEGRNIQAIPSYTDSEWKIVKALWDRIPSGSSSWMSAFFCFLRLANRRSPQPKTSAA